LDAAGVCGEIRADQVLTYPDISRQHPEVASIKISSKVEKEQWQALQKLARESHRSISGLLTEAISEFVRKRRLRPEVLDHLENSMDENEELDKRLAE
jgi:predicted transcriptional regulator